MHCVSPSGSPAGEDLSCAASSCEPGTSLKSVGAHGRTECVEGQFSLSYGRPCMCFRNWICALHGTHNNYGSYAAPDMTFLLLT